MISVNNSTRLPYLWPATGIHCTTVWVFAEYEHPSRIDSYKVFKLAIKLRKKSIFNGKIDFSIFLPIDLSMCKAPVKLCVHVQSSSNIWLALGSSVFLWTWMDSKIWVFEKKPRCDLRRKNRFFGGRFFRFEGVRTQNFEKTRLGALACAEGVRTVEYREPTVWYCICTNKSCRTHLNKGWEDNQKMIDK